MGKLDHVVMNEEETNEAVEALRKGIEDAIKVGETEWETIWADFDRDAAELLKDMQQELLDQAFGLPDLLPTARITRMYLLVSRGFDLLATLAARLSGIPAQVLVKVTVLRFPIPRKWHQRVIPLDDGIRLGITIMTTALLDTIQSPTLPFEMFIKRWGSKIKLIKFIRTIPDFNPLEAAAILKSKVIQVVLRLVTTLLTIGLMLGVLAALILVAIRLNDPVQAGRIVPFALPQDAPRKTLKQSTRVRLNTRRGEEP
jgi:hypothetical protein